MNNEARLSNETLHPARHLIMSETFGFFVFFLAHSLRPKIQRWTEQVHNERFISCVSMTNNSVVG